MNDKQMLEQARKLDSIGFIYQDISFKHDADGVSVVTLNGQSMVSGAKMSLSFDARAVPVKQYEGLRSGDFIMLNDFKDMARA